MKNKLNNLFSMSLADEVLKIATIKEIEKDTIILHSGQYVKVLPIVLEGRIKVYVNSIDKDMLLYYIKPGESCIMSFSAIIENKPSKVSALTEIKSKVLLIPVSKVDYLLKEFPEFSFVFYKLYYERYSELIEKITSNMFESIETRVLNYLDKKKEVEGSNVINVTHKQIALDLGSSREVISRALKKIEQKEKIKLHNSKIEILKM